MEKFNFSKNINGILITSPKNIRWLCGFNGSFGLVILTPNNKRILISDSRYAETVKKNLGKGWEFQLFDKNFKKNFGEKFSGLFQIEDCTTLSDLKKYKKFFPNLNFRQKTNFIEKFRNIKTENEINKIKIAQNHIDKILIPFLKTNLKENVTEKQLVFMFEHAIRDNGNFGISFDTIIAFSENSAIPHHNPSERKLKKGDNILIDCGAKFKGYHSDMTRNFIFGTAKPNFINKYNLCLQAQNETLKQYKVGTKIKNLEKSCRKILGSEEKYFIHSLGHGVGLDIHEAPKISTKNNEKLKENQVVTCEPGLYYHNEFGIRIEDILVIKNNNPEILSKTSKELIVF